MSSYDSSRHNDRRLVFNQAETFDSQSRPIRSAADTQKPTAGRPGTDSGSAQRDSRLRFEKTDDSLSQLAGQSRERDFPGFPGRHGRGKAKLCDSCGGIMTKSSRMILSFWSGVLVVMMGAMLMTAYGLATNFFHPPWFIRFVLPAAYYVGSIFLGVGLLFFFIRERIWYCGTCKQVDKR